MEMPFKDAAKRIDYHRRYNIKWTAAHPGFKNKYNWRIRGLNPIAAERMYSSSGRCAICDVLLLGSHKHLDHDHSTTKPRGVLCSKCNHAIGLMHDNKETLQKAMEYLLRQGIQKSEERK